MTSVGLDLALDLLSVCNSCGEKLGFNVEVVLELGAENVYLNVACAGDDHLVGLGVVDECEGYILFIELCKTAGDFVVLAFCFGSDSH